MALENLLLGRICLHEVHRRADDKSLVTPSYSSDMLVLKGRAKDAFISRVLAAFKSSAQCMEMSIRVHDAASAVAQAANLIRQTDADFVRSSRVFADKLADAQDSRQYPGGVVAVFDGTVGNPAQHFVGVMKAELHEGFVKTQKLGAQFVDNLFLSPKTKLYKIGLFISDGAAPRPALPAGWTALLYDSLMTAAQRDNAAVYFHGRFLGLSIPENSAQKTKEFFERTKEFIKTRNISEYEKVDLYNSLYSYLKVDQSPTVQVSEFGDRFFDDDMNIDYTSHMKKSGVSVQAINKDLSEVAGALKLRRVRFTGNLQLSGPPEVFARLVTVETVIPVGRDEKWTQITVKGPIEAQE